MADSEGFTDFCTKAPTRFTLNFLLTTIPGSESLVFWTRVGCALGRILDAGEEVFVEDWTDIIKVDVGTDLIVVGEEAGNSLAGVIGNSSLQDLVFSVKLQL